MKKCSICGTLVDDSANFCSSCGSAELTAEAAPEETAPAEQYTGEVQGYYYDPSYRAEPVSQETLEGNGNVLAGVVGSLLFGLIGAALYFGLYQIGVVAGICGLVTFVLANFGYTLFARPENKLCKTGIVVSIIVTIVVIAIAEYLCLSYEIFKVYKDYGITFFDAVRAAPEFLAEPEVRNSVIKELGMAYLFSAAAMISYIVRRARGGKR